MRHGHRHDQQARGRYFSAERRRPQPASNHPPAHQRSAAAGRQDGIPERGTRIGEQHEKRSVSGPSVDPVQPAYRRARRSLPGRELLGTREAEDESIEDRQA